MLRTVLSVLAGFFLWTILWLGGNAILTAAMLGEFQADGSTDNTGVLMLLLTLSLIFSVLAGYVTALAAQHNKMKHVLALGILQLVVGIFVQTQFWALLPLWYHLIFLALLVPGIWLGGKIRVVQEAKIAAI